jgi:tripartite-type tricarboxylate transporter receptor subunit TctC
LHVPYKGAGPALLDIMAGRVDILFDQVSSSSNYIEQGKVTALAVSSAARWKSLANVPTFAESGLQGFVITNFTGLVAPKGTPSDVLEKLNKAANEALQDDAVKKSFATMGVEAVGGSPQQFSALIKDDLQRWAALIKEKGIKLD